MAAFRHCPEVVTALYAAFDRPYLNVIPRGANVGIYRFVCNTLDTPTAINIIVMNLIATVENIDNEGFIILGAPNPRPFSCRTYGPNGGATTYTVTVRLVRKPRAAEYRHHERSYIDIS